jgi:tetratricopeptide (TPR) repeat protein
VIITPDDLIPEVYTPGLEGSLQPALISATRRHGRVAYPFTGMDALLAELAANHPAIVLVNLSFFWYPRWHYAVAVGYDKPGGDIILHSGALAGERLSLRTFNNIWRRSGYWGLLILPPGELPVTVREDAWMEAVLGLDQADRIRAAREGYETAVRRWPENFAAWGGLGNFSFKTGDMATAARAFKRAVQLDPASGPALNNLACVLLKMGRRDEALQAAQKAVTLGGPFLEEFRKTLNEIKKTALPRQRKNSLKKTSDESGFPRIN